MIIYSFDCSLMPVGLKVTIVKNIVSLDTELRPSMSSGLGQSMQDRDSCGLVRLIIFRLLLLPDLTVWGSLH